MPIRQVSDEQVAEIQRERQRMEQIRLRMEMQKISDRQAGMAIHTPVLISATDDR